MTFGSLLRQLREEKRLRQVDVANAIGVSTVYICDIEKDRRNPPSYKKLQLIAGKLELTEEKHPAEKRKRRKWRWPRDAE